MTLPTEVTKCVRVITSYAYEETSWNKIKTELMNMLPLEYRSMFSQRDPSTRELVVNDFEKQIMTLWKEVTGIELAVMPVQWKINRRTGKPRGRPKKTPGETN